VPRLSGAALFATLALAQAAIADWQIVPSNTESGAVRGVEHRHIVLRDSARNENATIELALFSPKTATLRLVDNSEGSETLAEAMRHEKCVGGINGGYFDTDFKPIGLRVIDGETVSPLVRARLLTGVLGVSARGIEILRVSDFPRRRKFDAAIECGPFLVDGETRVPNLDDQRSARRTFVGVSREGRAAALGVSSELTLAQLAELLANRSMPNDFRIWRALNLDGGSSSAFWFRRKDGSVFSIAEDKAVRDFVAISPR
jgi:uncharacterized protein YigE (DUF2233 family)